MLVVYEIDQSVLFHPQNEGKISNEEDTVRNVKYEAENESLLQLFIFADKFFICCGQRSYFLIRPTPHFNMPFRT